MNAKRLMQVGAFALAVASSSSAFAAGGVVSGTIRTWVKLNLACNPNVGNSYCTGARYTISQFDSYQPIKNAVVVVKDSSSGDVIGEGFTNASGNFAVSWYRSSHPGTIHIEWYPEHRDNRFRVLTKGGNRWVFWSSGFTAADGTTSSSPQVAPVGLSWGTSSAPHSVANTYYAAEQMWDDALSASALMVARFTNEKIKLGDWGGQSMVASDNNIHIDTTHALEFDTITHEMGHEASDEASGDFKFCGAYGRDGVDGHSLTSPEWQCASFEEGVATFLGSRALYWQTAYEPIMFGMNLENPNGYSCSGTQNRWEVMTSAFLRDFYDARNDASDATSTGYGRIFDVLDAFGGGEGNRDKNEPWKRFKLNLDDKDGRSAEDFRWVAVNREGFSESTMNSLYTLNCSPVGD